MNTEKIELEDSNNVLAFILRHGKNQWNDITEKSIEAQLDLIAKGLYFGLLSKADNEITAVLLTTAPDKFARFFSAETKTNSAVGHVSEVVVNSLYAGQGLGKSLLEKAKILFKKSGVAMVYAERHADNIASARLMSKLGFEVVDTFEDYPRRQAGSKKTCICMVRIK